VIPGIFEVTSLEIGGIGLLNIDGIEDKFPQLRYLDINSNKIYSLDALDQLNKLKKLYSVNLEDNPITIHLHLNQMIME